VHNLTAGSSTQLVFTLTVAAFTVFDQDGSEWLRPNTFGVRIGQQGWDDSLLTANVTLDLTSSVEEMDMGAWQVHDVYGLAQRLTQTQSAEIKQELRPSR
jgi:hypothetical protein